MTKRIAIIGTGISGLTCAHLLHSKHDIRVYEANDYIGGHTATIDVEVNGESHAIDTGFIVFNDWTYPNFIKLLKKLDVKSQPSEMSFSVKNLAENLEYNGNTINSLFAQRRNILRPKFIRIVRDILKFNKLCKSLVNSEVNVGKMTLSDFIKEHTLSDDFTHNYIYPMCAAIWSASLEQVKSFPLQFFLQFFNNHGLLNITDRPQWHTLIGGSRSYIKPLIHDFEHLINLNSPVSRVQQTDRGYLVTIQEPGHPEQLSSAEFDEVIFACHSDQALRMLDKPSEAHQAILGGIPYANNEVILHTDTNILPKRKLAWASWNYQLKGYEGEQQSPTTLTYNMNILQRITSNTTFCVTLNSGKDLDPSKILRTFNYAHPQFSTISLAAQLRRDEICGVDGIHFCGAYWYNGFHEDGVRSALDVCKRFGESL